MADTNPTHEVRIVFRAPGSGSFTALDVHMTAAERDRLCQDFAHPPTDGFNSETGTLTKAPLGGVYEVMIERKQQKIAIRFDDVLYIT